MGGWPVFDLTQGRLVFHKGTYMVDRCGKRGTGASDFVALTKQTCAMSGSVGGCRTRARWGVWKCESEEKAQPIHDGGNSNWTIEEIASSRHSFVTLPTLLIHSSQGLGSAT